MVTTSEAIEVLYPLAISNIDFVCEVSGIIKWDSAKLGTQPTQAQLDAVTRAQVDAAKALKYRTEAKSALSAAKADSATLRALLLIILDEFNLHTAKTNSILTAIDNATTLATLKTAVAAITDLPTRTAQQLRNAIQNKIDAGDADT